MVLESLLGKHVESVRERDERNKENRKRMCSLNYGENKMTLATFTHRGRSFSSFAQFICTSVYVVVVVVVVMSTFTQKANRKGKSVRIFVCQEVEPSTVDYSS